MTPRNVLLKEFLRANKELLNSSLDPIQKVEAIRKQTMALEELTNSSNEHDKISVFRSHFDQFNVNDNDYLSHIEDRSKNVEKLLQGLPSRPSPSFNLTAEKFLQENKIILEPVCSGKYASCVEDEICAEDLKMFHNKLPEEQSPAQYNAAPPRKIAKTDTFIVDQKSMQGHQPNLNRFSTSLPADSAASKMPVVRSNREEEMTAAPSRNMNLSNFTSNNSTESGSAKIPGFRTAREEMILQSMKKNGDPSSSSGGSSNALFNYGASKRSLGARRNVRSGFVPPIRQEENSSPRCTPPDGMDASPTDPVDERLRNIDPKMIQLITNEIMHKYKPIEWDDIAGLEYAKSTIKEAVVWPLLRPDIFTGLRRPPRGILLFGPPGTGKTLIGKCIASQSRSTFFSISASSLTSKWVGDGEKMVRALFAVAAVNQPSVVFIDEIDSLLSQRSESEHESSRRIKTEFLVQLDGACTSDDERILIVGATNRPQELDEAARRRLVRRLYIPLPDLPARIQILTNLLQTVRNAISRDEISEVGSLTDGYSGADMETLCREASMEPIRSIPSEEIPFFNVENVRPVQFSDFHSALLRVRASVTQKDLQQYCDWNRTYGAGQ